MRGSGLTRYRPENQGGGGFLESFVSGVLGSAKSEAKKEGWKAFKSGGPLGSPSLFAGGRGVKRGAIRSAKRGVKRKADWAIDRANASHLFAQNASTWRILVGGSSFHPGHGVGASFTETRP